MIEITIDLCSNRLTLVFVYLGILCRVMYDRFDLPTNYVEDPEALIRRTKLNSRKS